MDNPAGCPRAHAQAVGCPQAPQGPTTTQTKKQQRPGVAINYHAQSTDHQRRLTNRRHQPSIYTAKRATPRNPRSVTIPEIAGHVRRNAQVRSALASQMPGGDGGLWRSAPLGATLDDVGIRGATDR